MIQDIAVAVQKLQQHQYAYKVLLALGTAKQACTAGRLYWSRAKTEGWLEEQSRKTRMLSELTFS